MDRIIVVGPSGSGKTTLARSLAQALGCVHVEMDALWWEAGWTEAGAVAFRDRATAALAADRWVADGNYFSNGSREVVWPLADTVVWLDLSRGTTMARIVRRTTRRSLRRTELWNGNRETLANAVGRDGLIRFAWRAYPNYGRRYAAIRADPDPDLAHLTWIRLRTPGEVRRWLAATVGTDVTP